MECWNVGMMEYCAGDLPDPLFPSVATYTDRQV